jgi:hypothetical protein
MVSSLRMILVISLVFYLLITMRIKNLRKGLFVLFMSRTINQCFLRDLTEVETSKTLKYQVNRRYSPRTMCLMHFVRIKMRVRNVRRSRSQLILVLKINNNNYRS